MDALNAVWNEASTQMYAQASAQQQGGPQQGGPQSAPPPGGGQQAKPDEKKVEDADFEVMDDKK
jgi:hypothetical protein